MRLPRAWDLARKKEFVRATLSILGLEEIRHSRIGDETVRGISGGQRKRVNIGLELVADPTVLFLDEPTSGLDSTSSLEVMGQGSHSAQMPRASSAQCPLTAWHWVHDR